MGEVLAVVIRVAIDFVPKHFLLSAFHVRASDPVEDVAIGEEEAIIISDVHKIRKALDGLFSSTPNNDSLTIHSPQVRL